jgi:hypothetical protein
MTAWLNNMAWYAGGVTAGMVCVAILPTILYPGWTAAISGAITLFLATWASWREAKERHAWWNR